MRLLYAESQKLPNKRDLDQDEILSIAFLTREPARHSWVTVEGGFDTGLPEQNLRLPLWQTCIMKWARVRAPLGFMLL